MRINVAEIRMWAGSRPPKGWLFCDGSLLSVSGHSGLFAKIGNTYGGDGVTTFALPDLRGRVPICAGQGAGLAPRDLGGNGGTESRVLDTGNIPPHAHAIGDDAVLAVGGEGKGVVAIGAAANSWIGNSVGKFRQGPGTGTLAGLSGSVEPSAGGNAPVENVSAFGCINFIISLGDSRI